MKLASEYIEISDLYSQNEKIFVNLKVSEGVKKYFFKTDFTIEYDRNIDNDKSILIIPALSVVAPIAWSSGADIILGKVDATYLDSLNKTRKILEGWYPQLATQSQIRPADIVENKFQNKKSGVFFSGGLDSMATYFGVKADRPTLITLLMSDPRYLHYYERVKKNLQNFADNEGTEINFIRADIWNGTNGTINNMLIAKDSNLPVWWRMVSLGLVTIGLGAPLTAAAGIGSVRLSAPFDFSQIRPDGSYYLAVTQFSWADINLVYDGVDLTRQQKIRQFLKGNRDYYRYLLICNNTGGYEDLTSKSYPMNCGYCEKCMRTITGLILEGIDPSDCHFAVDSNILEHVKHALASGSLNLPEDIMLFWRDIQKHVPAEATFDDVTSTKYSAKQFFEWFRKFDPDDYKSNKHNILKSEFLTSMKHKGFSHALKRTIGYATRRVR